MPINTFCKISLFTCALCCATATLANPNVYVEGPSIENVMRASSYVSYTYRTEAKRHQWVGNDDLFFIRLSSIDTFGDQRSALIASLAPHSYRIERVSTNCKTKDTIINTLTRYDVNGKVLESNKEEEKIGRPIPDSYLAEAVIVMCDALAIIPANPNVDGEKITASAPFMNVINEHVRAKGVTRRAITVEQIEAHFQTTLNQRK
ncbi:hypothetical protein ACFHYE_05385 [Pasteurella multocida]